MTSPSAGAGRGGILSLAIKDKTVLYSAYMSFLRNGGLFIPTNKAYKLGDEVFLLLDLMDEAEVLPIAGRVVWITPPGSQGNKTVGIGIEFNDQEGSPKQLIENYLLGTLNADRMTHTM